MRFFRRAGGPPSSLAILPGTFNPVTVAHLALGDAARKVTDEVLFVLPQVLPHKAWEGAPFEKRVELLLAAIEGEAGYSVASSDQGLFVEIAEECRTVYGQEPTLSFICGADAAERIATWDYGDPDAFARMMCQFDLLVAERGARFSLPHRPLVLEGNHAHVSATEVRGRIARGEPWEHLVPVAIRDEVRRIYGGPATGQKR
jgi:nicotinic acid mononucleotide adenylyltransferase